MKPVPTEYPGLAMDPVRLLILLVLPLLLLVSVCSRPTLAQPDPEHQLEDSTAERETEPYHTPLAGEPFQLFFRGKILDIPGQDRSHQASLNLGIAAYVPEIVDASVIPLVSFYMRRIGDKNFLRIAASGVENEVDLAKRIGNLEMIGRFENYTNPFGEEGFVDNKEVEQSSVRWGTLSGFVGAGLRYPVSPYQIDNDLRLQVLGRLGYLYSNRTGDTGRDVRLPPDTALYGVKFRGRYDGIRRNLLELPHDGTAAGLDLDFVHRQNWTDSGNRLVNFEKEDFQDYFSLSGYILTAFGIPGLSERNRFVSSLHAGLMKKNSSDRYNAFRFNGGPFAQESDDTYRPNYPGALDYVTIVSRYLMFNLEYRRELLPFLYLQIRNTLLWADRSTIVGANQIGFKCDNGQSFSLAVTSGFLWDSQIFMQYAWDSGFLRNGKAGSSVTLLWSKSLSLGTARNKSFSRPPG